VKRTIKSKLIVLTILLSIYSLAVPSANAIEPWKISITSNLANIDQFENRELKFSVAISDKTVINFLKQPGTEVIGNAILAPVLQPLVTDTASGLPKSINAYSCYNPQPKALAGNSGGSALRMQKAGDENRIDLQFSCWFPMGMKVQAYTLNIKLSVNLNNSCCSRPNPNPWDNTQVFLFGNYPESMRPTWYYQDFQQSAGGKYSIGPNVLVQTIPEMPVINVVRTAPRTSPESLTFNTKNLIEITEKLKANSETLKEAYQNYKALLENLANNLSALITRSSNLEKQNLKSKYTPSIQELSKQLKSNQSNVDQIFEIFSTIKPGSLDADVRLKYLYGLDFDVVSKPEVLIAQYPDFKLMKADPTPYLRFVVKSKTAIISTHIGISYSGGGGPWFEGNVILPGSPPINDQWGGGLVLVENQQWDGSMFLTSLLIGPKYTPVKSTDLEILNKVECSSGWFEDAAGNLSNYWNTPPTSDCIPKATQAVSAAKDFDNLKQVYSNLAQANENVQQLRIIPANLQNKLPILSLISTEADLIKSKLNLLDLQITQERTAQAKVLPSRASTIICIKGKIVKKVTAVKPGCPSGYKKK
jgi:hypothetical protein